MAHYPEVDAGPVDVDFPPGMVRPGLYERSLKRIFDCVVVLLAAPIVVPLVLLLALLIRRDGGPAFYRQERLGLNGRIFRIWKLRSMRVGADQLLAEHLAADPAARAEWEATQKLKDDPRITPIGRPIRKTSLDELPQLWNVLLGDMSLVGPRPMMPDQAPLYPGVAYYELRPGVTGFWQVRDRNGTTFAGRAAYDTRYARRMSFGTDLRVLLATVLGGAARHRLLIDRGRPPSPLVPVRQTWSIGPDPYLSAKCPENAQQLAELRRLERPVAVGVDEQRVQAGPVVVLEELGERPERARLHHRVDQELVGVDDDAPALAPVAAQEVVDPEHAEAAVAVARLGVPDRDVRLLARPVHEAVGRLVVNDEEVADAEPAVVLDEARHARPLVPEAGDEQDVGGSDRRGAVLHRPRAGGRHGGRGGRARESARAPPARREAGCAARPSAHHLERRGRAGVGRDPGGRVVGGRERRGERREPGGVAETAGGERRRAERSWARMRSFGAGRGLPSDMGEKAGAEARSPNRCARRWQRGCARPRCLSRRWSGPDAWRSPPAARRRRRATRGPASTA